MTSPVALITGGAIRIGRDICKKFHENGYDIVCHFNKSETAANELKSELNEIRADSCGTICFDLNDHNDLENFVIEIKKKFNNNYKWSSNLGTKKKLDSLVSVNKKKIFLWRKNKDQFTPVTYDYNNRKMKQKMKIKIYLF